MTIDRQTLRLQLGQGRVTQRSYGRHMWNRYHRASRGGLISDDERGGALYRHDFAALDVLGRSLLRRADEQREEQRCEQRM